MSAAAVENPVTSFYVPVQEDELSLASFHAEVDKLRFSKKNFTEGYRCVSKPVPKSEQSSSKNKKQNKVQLLEYYVTKNIIGNPICNARTGNIYPQYRVGQIHEYLFFKTRLSTEESLDAQYYALHHGSNKSTPISPLDKPDPEVLFYDSPEEYELHHNLVLAPELKEKWRARYESLLRQIEKSKRQSESNDTHIKILSHPSQSNTPPGLSTASAATPPATRILFRPSTPDCPPPDL